MTSRPLVSIVLFLGGCSGIVLGDAGGDADAGVDSGAAFDAGKVDGGVDAGRDTDAGRMDAGRVDAGRTDGGTDAGMDAGRDAGMDAGRDAGAATCPIEDQRSDVIDISLGFNDQWQSFMPSRNGTLVEVALHYRSGNPVNLRIFAGEGPTGTMLLDQPMPTRDALAVHRIALTTPIAVSGGSTYTIQIAGVNQQWNASTANPYPRGRGNRDATTDFVFTTYLACP